MSTVAPIVSPAYVNLPNMEHRDIVPVALVSPTTGEFIPSGDVTVPLLQELSESLLANTVKIIPLPAVTSYLRLQNTNASGHIYFRFNIAPTAGDFKSITLDPGEIFHTSMKFKATNIQILRASNGNFNLITA
jgi:hypothetical protein